MSDLLNGERAIVLEGDCVSGLATLPTQTRRPASAIHTVHRRRQPVICTPLPPVTAPQEDDLQRLFQSSILACSGTTLVRTNEGFDTRYSLIRFNQPVAHSTIKLIELITLFPHEVWMPYLRAFSELSSALRDFSRTEICHE